MKIKCLKHYKIYEDCRTLKVFHEGKDYDVSNSLGEKLIEGKIAKKIKAGQESKPKEKQKNNSEVKPAENKNEKPEEKKGMFNGMFSKENK